ncbi:DUF2283 domain-containing protein [Nocardia sp. NPDC003482]
MDARSWTWDKRADAAYLAFGDGPRRVARTVPVRDGETVVAALDFGADGALLGIELLNAEVQLSAGMKAAAEIISGP